MASLIPNFEYDIFLSYRHKDNKGDQWVTEFVKALRTELETTFKEDINIYFDENPHDGLHAYHVVDDSLIKKLKCLILIPVVSRTYCDEGSFAWVNEFKVFIDQAQSDPYGLKVNVSGGNVASRVLPIRIHELDQEDISLFESTIGSVMRPIDFIYKESGVNLPLLPTHDRKDNLANTDYRNQINKVANAIREIIQNLKLSGYKKIDPIEGPSDKIPEKKIEIVKEVKQRNILSASLMYLLMGLLLWKITDIGVDLLQLSSNLVKIVSLSLVACFPIAMALAWLYERSPQGFVRVGSMASKKNLFLPHEKKPLTSNGYLAVLALTLLVLFIIFPKSIFKKETDVQPFAGKSLAILPFVNLSQNPEEDYLSDGITEDIITQVSKISDLKVIARSSVMRYKKTEKDIVDIGRELDVETILEGTVRLSGDRARITANLSSTSNRQQLWAETYDKEMKEIFELQAEVASDIVNALNANFSSAVKSAQPTKSIEAYNLYLKGNYNFDRSGHDGYQLSLRQGLEAVELDPNFALAYTLVADSYSLIAYYHYNDLYASELAWEKAEEAAAKAIELDPSLADAHDAMAYILRTYKWNWSEAENELKIALSLNPKLSSVHRRYALLLAATGRFDEAISEVLTSLELDPLGAFYNSDLARIYYYAGQNKKAIEVANRSFELEPGYRPALSMLACSLDQMGLKDSSVVVASMSQTRSTTDYEGFSENFKISPKPYANYWKEVLNRTLEDSKKDRFPNMVIAVLYMRNNDTEGAIKSLQKSFQEREGGMVYVNVEPIFNPLHTDPRFQKIVQSMGLSK